VLVTSRHPGWGGLADRLDVDVLTRTEAVALLTVRLPGLDPATADALAAEFGDLPLALEQAAGYLEATALPPAAYLDKFRTRRARMLGRGRDLAHGGNLDTVWSLALDRLRTQAPAAVALLDLCAHLGPEPIPLALFADHPDRLGPPLGVVVAGVDPEADLDDVVGAVLAYSLARRAGDAIELHRLVAAAIRAHQPPGLHEQAAAAVRALLVAHRPADGGGDPADWPTWAALAPHVLTAPALHPDDPADVGGPARRLLADTGWYLRARGAARAAHTFTADLHRRWKTTLGDDHPDTLRAANNLAAALRGLGDYQASRVLHEDTLARRRRVFGDDHPDTLTSANNLARDLHGLGDYRAARVLDEDTLARCRRVFGDDHPDTLRSANNLARDLHGLGDYRASRALHEDALIRLRRVLGDDHPHTLYSAYNLAADLRGLGDYGAARALDEDTLARRRRVLGDDHPDTLHSAYNLAADLNQLGDHRAAREWEAFVERRRRSP
jgi:hypothetical protein